MKPLRIAVVGCVGVLRLAIVWRRILMLWISVPPIFYIKSRL